MCEFLERAGLRGTPTEEVREWSTMTHRVVELCGPFPAPDDMRVELWLHEESATRLLDMCDRIDAEFDRTKAENAKLRKYAELYAGLVKTCGCDFCPYCDDFEACEDAEAVSMSEGCALYMEMRELRIEVDG